MTRKSKTDWKQTLHCDCEAAGINTVGLNELLDMAATLRHELEQLQSAVDLEGITYTTVSREGNTMIREQPAHKFLQETRHKYFNVLKELGLTMKAKKAVDVVNVDVYDPDFR